MARRQQQQQNQPGPAPRPRPQQQPQQQQQQQQEEEEDQEEVLVLVKPSGMAVVFEILAKIHKIPGATLVDTRFGNVPLNIVNAHLNVAQPEEHWDGIRRHYMEGEMMAAIFRGPPGFVGLVKKKKKDIRTKMHAQLEGERQPHHNYIHSSDTAQEAQKEINVWKRWIGQRRHI